jgi:hypothetical protein
MDVLGQQMDDTKGACRVARPEAEVAPANPCEHRLLLFPLATNISNPVNEPITVDCLPGGKARLAQEIVALLPRLGRTYIEPFVGRGDLFWSAASAGLKYERWWKTSQTQSRVATLQQ